MEGVVVGMISLIVIVISAAFTVRGYCKAKSAFGRNAYILKTSGMDSVFVSVSILLAYVFVSTLIFLSDPCNLCSPLTYYAHNY